MPHYERRLPHWDVIGQPLFVTFRLRDSLPASRIFPPEGLSTGKAFVAMDRLLDRATLGPLFLRQPEVASLVVEAIRDGERRFRRYELHAFVVMPNHVHMLVTANVAAARWLDALKGFTGHAANRVLQRRGPFWLDESYDRLVRSREEFSRIQRYIEMNPVSASLVRSPELFPWSSAAALAA